MKQRLFSWWFVLPWLLVAWACNLAFVGSAPLYGVLLIAQLVCYGFALSGFVLDRLGKRFLLFYIPYYFLYMHCAACIAVVQALLGKRAANWTPTDRVASDRRTLD